MIPTPKPKIAPIPMPPTSPRHAISHQTLRTGPQVASNSGILLSSETLSRPVRSNGLHLPKHMAGTRSTVAPFKGKHEDLNSVCHCPEPVAPQSPAESAATLAVPR